MNYDRLAGICRQLKGRCKTGWGGVIRDPLLIADGERDLHTGKLRERYGLSQQTAARDLKDFFTRNRNWHRTTR